MAKSSIASRPKKSPKPYEGFPLTPHPSGRWCKKIRGKLHYFGKLDSPEAALERFNREWPFLKDGRTPPAIDTGDGCTVRLLCNAFLTAKQSKLAAGELSPRSFQDYFNTCGLLIDQFGRDRRVDDLRPDDFGAFRTSLAKRLGPVSLKVTIVRVRVVLKFGFEQRLVDRPVHFGQGFDPPSAKTIRLARNAQGVRLFTVDEVTRILAAADVQLKAMTLLGLNCGFGNSDCSNLPQSAIDLADGWVTYPRQKTGIERRVPLWPETVEALKAAIAARPEPKDPADAGLAFLTSHGRRWVRVQERQRATELFARCVAVDGLSKMFGRTLRWLGINSHRNFYTLRHNFETIAGESKDQVAVDAIMGHVDPSMGAQYRETISDARLKAVVDTVHAWLWPDAVT